MSRTTVPVTPETVDAIRARKRHREQMIADAGFLLRQTFLRSKSTPTPWDYARALADAGYLCTPSHPTDRLNP